ncbi:MAG: hypothetical protein LBM99_01520 [Bacillales bacterium]|jgi:hypothetical protein|nr:hypothetical protein [Bacillales bacterium]
MKKLLLLPLLALGLSACVNFTSSPATSTPSGDSSHVGDSSTSSSEVVPVIIEAEEALEVYGRLYDEYVESLVAIDGYTLSSIQEIEGVIPGELAELENDFLGYSTMVETLNVNYETVAMYGEGSFDEYYTNLDGSPLDIGDIHNTEKHLEFYDFENSQTVVIGVGNEELEHYSTDLLEEEEAVSTFREEFDGTEFFNNLFSSPEELDSLINEDPEELEIVFDFSFYTDEERTYIDIIGTATISAEIEEDVFEEFDVEINYHLDATTVRAVSFMPLILNVSMTQTFELSLLAPEIDVHILDSYLPLED